MIAENGPDEFYKGTIAEQIARGDAEKRWLDH